MLLHLINREDYIGGISPSEGSFTITMLMVAEMVMLESFTADYFLEYNSFMGMTDEEYLFYVLKEIPKGTKDYKTIQGLINVLKERSRSHTLPLHKQRILADAIKGVRQFKEKRRAQLENFLANDIKVMRLLDFANAQYLKLEPIGRYKESEGKEDPLIERLKSVFCDPERIPVIEASKEVSMDLKNMNEIIGFSKEDVLPEFIIHPLYRIPEIKELTFQEINYTRENVLKKVAGFNNRLSALRKDCLNIDYTSSNIDHLREIINKNLEGFEELQTHITSELYIQKVRNSGYENFVRVSVCFASLETIAGYYVRSGMLESYVADILKTRIANELDLSRCCMFLFIDLYQTDDDELSED